MARKPGRVSGHVVERRLKGGEVALYSWLRVPDPGRPSGYRAEQRLIGRLWTRGGRPPAGYVTRRGAKDALRERIVDAGRAAGEAPEAAPLPTVAEVADDWLRAKGRPDGVTWQTLRDYEAVLRNHLLPRFGDMPIDAVEDGHVDDWMEDALDRGVKARTVVRCLMVLAQLLRWAYRRHKVTRPNPASGAAVPRPSVSYDRSRFNVLTPPQVCAVAEAMPPYGRPAVLVAAWTGVRIGELVELRWKDVAFADERLHVRRSHGRNGTKGTKGGRGRSVPMMPDLAALLDGLSRRGHSTEDDDLVLVNERGDRVCGWTLRRHFYEAVEVAGLGHLREADPPLVFHDLRHTFGTRAARVMPSLSDVQALLGHAHISTTMRYVHHQPGARDAERLAAAFADEPDPLDRPVLRPVLQTGQFGAQPG